MRNGITGSLLTLGLLAVASPVRAQILSLDARRVGMGGLNLKGGGDLARYNPAYRAVPSTTREGRAPKATIPLPLGLIDFLKDHPPSQWDTDPLFDPKSPEFNPFELANLFLHPPVSIEVKKIPTPTNDVEFTIGRNELIIDLGKAQVLIPSDNFGFGGNSRLLDFGVGFKGFRVGIMGWMHHDIQFALSDSLRAVLKDGHPVQPTMLYAIQPDWTSQTGIAPFVSYSGRVVGDSTRAFYLGGSVRSYLGAAYGRASGNIGFLTPNPIFGVSGPLEAVNAIATYSKFGNSTGKGWGGDVGFVYASGPVEFGFGINDIGAKLTWSDTRRDSLYWDAAGDTVVSITLQTGVESETELPTSYIGNLALAMSTGTTVGASILFSGRHTTITVGGEQRVGLLALRGGVGRDQRKKLQLGFGAGLFLGSISLDVGFATHSTALSDERGITMVTSLSIY